VRELAGVWKPGVPTADNPEYIAKARNLEKDLETAVLEMIEARTAKDKSA
jgi:CPA2 family monovalent cation:H+ antiporter-2